MNPDLSFLSPEKREAFVAALNHFYDGDLECFLAQSSRALIDAYDSDQQLTLPLTFAPVFPKEDELGQVLDQPDSY